MYMYYKSSVIIEILKQNFIEISSGTSPAREFGISRDRKKTLKKHSR